jgi:hypothetical protein
LSPAAAAEAGQLALLTAAATLSQIALVVDAVSHQKFIIIKIHPNDGIRRRKVGGCLHRPSIATYHDEEAFLSFLISLVAH